MAYDLQTNGESFILSLSGTVDLSETTSIKDLIKNEPKAGFKKLIVECGETEYMDSSAVALLLFAKRAAEENQMVFEIRSISVTAKKIIDMAGLGAVFSLPETTEKVDENSQEVNSVEESPELDMSAADDDLELNLPEEQPKSSEPAEADVEENDNDNDMAMDFSEDTSSGDDFVISFDDTPADDGANEVDNTVESGKNKTEKNDSGDSKSDDFEFNPGTFE
jgi:anti-anti-sigma factor